MEPRSLQEAEPFRARKATSYRMYTIDDLYAFRQSSCLLSEDPQGRHILFAAKPDPKGELSLLALVDLGDPVLGQLAERLPEVGFLAFHYDLHRHPDLEESPLAVQHVLSPTHPSEGGVRHSASVFDDYPRGFDRLVREVAQHIWEHDPNADAVFAEHYARVCDPADAHVHHHLFGFPHGGTSDHRAPIECLATHGDAFDAAVLRDGWRDWILLAELEDPIQSVGTRLAYWIRRNDLAASDFSQVRVYSRPI